MAFGSIFKKKAKADPAPPTLTSAGSLVTEDTLIASTPSASSSSMQSPFLAPKPTPVPAPKGDESTPRRVRRFGDPVIVEVDSSGVDTPPDVRRDRIRKSNQFYIPHRSRYIIKYDLKPGDPVLALHHYRGHGTWRHGVVTDDEPTLFGHYVNYPVRFEIDGEEYLVWHYPRSGKILYDTLLAQPGARETYMV
ncbi:hypothetical protein FKP32DRAFT_1602320 [Trametes sanguinea]|nr:hypothetical protein FKP32DRAFT_1602320 [Trametes sanguinea]